MPTAGHSQVFQELPMYADQPHIKNSFTTNHYKEINEDVIGALKFGATAINGLNDEDVRVSQRLGLSTKKLEVSDLLKLGQDSDDFIGGNYSTYLNLEANFPNFP